MINHDEPAQQETLDRQRRLEAAVAKRADYGKDMGR